jgi:hypothetical protein
MNKPFQLGYPILWLLFLPLCVFALGSANWAWAQEGEAPKVEKKKPASDLDKELLEGLGEDLLDGLPDLGPAKKPEQPKTNGDQPGPPKGSDIEGLDGEDIGQPGESTDPLTRIGQQMRKVESRIAQHDTSDNTQQLQDEIITGLEKLIEQAKQQQNSPQNSSSKKKPGSQRSKVKQSDQPAGQKQGDGSGNTSSKAAQDSSERLGADANGKVDMQQMRDLIKDVWGNLPERMREQMNQDAVEEFLPKYRLQIEEYFKRLAEEQEEGR